MRVCVCVGVDVGQRRIFAPPQHPFHPPHRPKSPQIPSVTGSAHCCLAAYWAKELGKASLLAYQASKRGGALRVELDEARGRVRLGGQAVLVKHGVLGC